MDDYINNISSIKTREKQENKASAGVNTEILKKLNVTTESFPQKLRQLLDNTSTKKSELDITDLDSVSLSLQHTKELQEKLDGEYEVLLLKQKNNEMQENIDRNNNFLADLRKELQNSKDTIGKQTPNPNTIQDVIRQWKLKVASYEESCEKAKAKFTKLAVPEHIYPKSLQNLVSTLVTLEEEANSLKLRAEDIQLARQARDALHSLRR